MPAIVSTESLPVAYQQAGQILHEIAGNLVHGLGAPAVLSALLSTYLQIAIDTGKTDTAKRLLPFALANLDALIAIREGEISSGPSAEGQG